MVSENLRLLAKDNIALHLITVHHIADYENIEEQTEAIVTIERLQEICSIIYEMFKELKETFTKSWSPNLWYNEDDRNRSVDLVCLCFINYVNINSMHYLG
ncbi:unnamed protein product [Schistosoma turkestanicum]|nr:unnamed protein product [Schistosoma turkestanicum]